MSELPPFDKLWNYSDPAATELKFREILDTHHTLSDMSYHLQLLTQIARTYSLRGMFKEAHAILAEVKEALPDTPSPERVRYHLERGRTYNSSLDKDNALWEFNEALKAAEALGDDFYTIDAMHMLAIVAAPEQAMEWNDRAIKLAMATTNERAKTWHASLCNNLGWVYFDKGDYNKAMEIFEQAYDLRMIQGDAQSIATAKWCIGRTMRAQGREDEALQIQMELLADNESPDEYNYEEIIECLKELGRNEEAEKYESKRMDLFKKNS